MSRRSVTAAAVIAVTMMTGLRGQAPEGGRNSAPEWQFVGGDRSSSRHSTLTDINTDTIDRLGGAWVTRLEGGASSRATPVIQGGVMYLTAGANVFAIDAKTGETIWTPGKSAAAASLVRSGRKVSMSRVFEPGQHFMRKNPRGTGAGSVVDYYGFIYHGQTITHIDALCHMWDSDGMWQGRDPDVEVTTRGATFGTIDAWSDGIITRGVLIDVPRHRGVSHVTLDQPVHGWEIEEIARAQGVDVEPGDALLVYSGKDAFVAAGGSYGGGDRPGLSVTCAKFIRDHDVSLLGWDMMAARPDPYGLAFPVHGVLFNYGVALLDNALLEPIADACAEEARYEFMFMALPLKVARGTGSPANPIAMF